MKIDIKLVDNTLPLPSYQTDGAVAFDLYSRIDMEVPAKSIGMIPLNVIIATPPGFGLFIASRSSTPKKKGLMCANGIGIIDQDYRGKHDEINYLCYNFTDEKVLVERGERIAQGMFLPVEIAEFNQVEEMEYKNRGGFGTTG